MKFVNFISHNFFAYKHFNTLTKIVVATSIGLVIASCSAIDHSTGKRHIVKKNEAIATNVTITHAAIKAELAPAAILAGVRPSEQKLTLLAYSEHGSKCDVLETNSYTTDSEIPNGCSDCDASCPAKEVGNETLEVFSRTSLTTKKGASLPLRPRSLRPVVGVKNAPVDQVSRLGRFISSRSPNKTSGGLSSACFGLAGTCDHPDTVQVVMAFDTSSEFATNAGLPLYNFPLYKKYSAFPTLAYHGGAHLGHYSRHGASSGGWDPLMSTIARAAGQAIASFPAKVSLTSGIGGSYFYSTSKDAIGETVFKAALRNPGKDEIPLWHIRLLFGEQVNKKGFAIEVISSDQLRWLNSKGDDKGYNKGKRYLSDRHVEKLLYRQFDISVNPDNGNITAEFKPKKDDYIPLHYEVSLKEDAEFAEMVQSSAIEENLKNPICNEEYY